MAYAITAIFQGLREMVAFCGFCTFCCLFDKAINEPLCQTVPTYLKPFQLSKHTLYQPNKVLVINLLCFFAYCQFLNYDIGDPLAVLVVWKKAVFLIHVLSHICDVFFSK